MSIPLDIPSEWSSCARSRKASGVLRCGVRMTRLRCLPPRLATLDVRTAKLPPKVADKAYLTPEHRAWSQAVIARARGACQDCNRTGVRLFADHVRELRDGGAAHDIANGRALCQSCHGRKTARERARRTAIRHAAAPHGGGSKV